MEIYNDTYCVYIHTNKINGKKYVGQTIYGNRPKKRWKNGGGYKTQKYFNRAIQKYGWDGFEHDIIASNLTKEEANNFESLLINKLKTNKKEYGYNLTYGGEGVTGYRHSEESKRKQKESMRKYYDDYKYIQRMRDIAQKTKVYQFTNEGIFIQSYDSTKEAERNTGIHSSGISRCALNKTPSAGGFIWLFEKDIKNINDRVLNYKEKKIRKEPIIQLTLDGEFVMEWKNSVEASKSVGVSYKNINSVCRGVRNMSGGYKWMYSSDYYSKD